MPMRVAIIGDGAMGTVCARIIAEKPHAAACVWGRDPARTAAIEHTRKNQRYLPGTRLSQGIKFTSDPAVLFCEPPELILCAVPTQFIREVLTAMRSAIPAGVPVVSVAKGIEIATLKRPSEVILDVLGPRPVAAFSGPSIASELARGLPATMVAAANTVPLSGGRDLALDVQDLFTTPYLRVYHNGDLLGVELAGALKNVIAIAAGIVDGMRAGNNAKAALLTRGLVEITRLGVALGALPETFAGLAGMGDLVTTCVSPEGRNRSFGERVGRGESIADALARMPGIVEGMPTCAAVVRLAKTKGIEMPIAEALHAVLFEGSNLREELAELMGRAPKHEAH